MEYLKATPEHDNILITHYLAIWDSYGTPPDHFSPDPQLKIRRFINEGRDSRELATFVAMDGTTVAGSVSCRVHLSPYPDVLRPDVHKHGYIWSVFVEPAYRRQGISRRLTELAIEYLRSIGCTAVVLHASEAGKPVYESLGFEPAAEMRLTFDKTASET
ncbi:GNAT family N-acetyltransferase [Rhizobium sp. LjRoot98]|uniref:GNAT family N-acetyltransferase n=1 Tax=unclassified Rhizobium TaxID=2613769 RepID=UPI0007125646|nr:GNAT family N-acetyltransferase [Rhizobium sp. Root1204]KQV33016.1 acetyltransferase [Rhizobium sp. Root1204]